MTDEVCAVRARRRIAGLEYYPHEPKGKVLIVPALREFGNTIAPEESNTYQYIATSLPSTWMRAEGRDDKLVNHALFARVTKRATDCGLDLSANRR